MNCALSYFLNLLISSHSHVLILEALVLARGWQIELKVQKNTKSVKCLTILQKALNFMKKVNFHKKHKFHQKA